MISNQNNNQKEADVAYIPQYRLGLFHSKEYLFVWYYLIARKDSLKK
jgi:hypothetical protein